MKKRGLKRYYRNLFKKNFAEKIIAELKSGNAEYDYEHIHLDGYPLTKWAEIKQHLDVLLASLIHSGLMQKQSVHHFKYGDIYAFNETTDVRLQCMFILPIMTSMIFQGHLPMCQKHRH